MPNNAQYTCLLVFAILLGGCQAPSGRLNNPAAMDREFQRRQAERRADAEKKRTEAVAATRQRVLGLADTIPDLIATARIADDIGRVRKPDAAIMDLQHLVRATRDRQLSALSEELIAHINRAPPDRMKQASRGWFTRGDRAHPTYKSVTRLQDHIQREHRNAITQKKNEQAARMAQAYFLWITQMQKQGKINAEQRRQGLIDRGLCPTCEGDGRERYSQGFSCVVCGGSGHDSVRQDDCLSCDNGTQVEYFWRDCKACNKTGLHKGG